jgi:hypothetical protein
MKYIFASLLSALLLACTKPTGIKAVISGADSIAINYYKGNGSMDTVVNMVMLKDKNKITQLAAYAETATLEHLKCGYDGSLHLFKRDMVIQDIDFRMNDVQCMYFSFLLHGKVFTTALSPEAKQFLQSVNIK